VDNFTDVFRNDVLIVAVIASAIAQGLKLPIAFARYGKVDLRELFTTGGMPSAHSALVSCLATGIGLTSGWGSPEFAIASLFAAIVMYDAAGVRQAAGKQARVLNAMVDELFSEHKTLNEERLKELLGHTPVQVLAGLALGIAIALIGLL